MILEVTAIPVMAALGTMGIGEGGQRLPDRLWEALMT